jgi:hypothetical protein
VLYSVFGPKIITLRSDSPEVDCGSVRQRVEIFFNPTAKNHPGEGTGETPNWFYYWQQTAAGDFNAVYDESLDTAGATRTPLYAGFLIWWAPSNFKIGDFAYSTFRDLGYYPNGPQTWPGIDSFHFTCVHECKHLKDFRNGRGHLDHDFDGIADCLEIWDGDNEIEPNEGETDPKTEGTYSNFNNMIQAVRDSDAEFRAYRIELLHEDEIGVYNSKDWSSTGTGRQWRDHPWDNY